MAIQSKHQQLKKAAEYFQPAKESVVMRPEFIAELEHELEAKYISYNTNQMKNKSKWYSATWIKGVALAGMAIVFVLAAVLVQQQVLSGSQDMTNFVGNGDTNVATKLGGELAYIEGDVEYLQDGEDAGWKTAESGITLAEGDSVRTFEDGRAIINLDDGSAIRLNYDSEVELTAMDPESMQITNVEGEVYTRVAKLEREFAVVTDEATYTSLGTAYTTVNTKNKEGVKVFHSKVQVDENDDSEAIVVEEGEEFYKDTGKIEKLTVEEIKKDEFALWNKEQDEQKSEYKDDLGKLADLTAPYLNILSPDNGKETDNAKITVKGTTEAGVTLKVAGKEVNVAENGSFSKQVSLGEGVNKLRIVAVDDAGNKTVKTIKVTYEPVEATEAESSSSSSSSATSGSISISGVQQVDGGLKVTWSVSNLTASQGFKVVYGTSANPTYPANNPTYFSDPSTRSAVIGVTDGGTYHFRVCRYTGSGCDNYSNDVVATAPTVAQISAITGFSFNGTNKLTWGTDTGEAGKGFKVVFSTTNSDPHFPTDGYLNYTYNMYQTISENGYYRICAYNQNNGCYAESAVIEVTVF